ncbi:MAG: ABC transporter permease [Streptosporangiaceae bacterium]|jgi:peptide/nickel transport system permease protein
MALFLVKRVLQALLVILLVTIIVFGLLHALPGGPARGILGQQATQAQINTFNQAQGFDKPLPEQYWLYLSRLLEGNLGESYKLNQSVASLIGQRLPKTLVLSGLSTLLALIIALPLGVWQAVRRRKLPDHLITAGAFVGYATPSFFVALLLITAFSDKLTWFPPQAPQASTLGGILADPRALVLPVLTGTIATVAVFSRYVRSAVLDNLGEDYTRTARAKGAKETRVVGIHVLRNSLTPVITMLGYYVPVVFSGAIVIESIFNFPGMGLMFWTAAQTSDYPTELGVVLIIAVATVTGSLLADLLQAAADPRVRGSLR